MSPWHGNSGGNESLGASAAHFCAHFSGLDMKTDEPLRLGGFKILKGLDGTSIGCNSNENQPFLLLLQELSREKINLPYLTLSHGPDGAAFHFLAETGDSPRISDLLNVLSPCTSHHLGDTTVLSVFPHRNNPFVLERLLRVAIRQELSVQGFASSPSALSVCLERRELEKLVYALFGPFVFSSYRTPSDWKLAQKGKEALFKEVVASYQEKRPKIYALECWTRATIFCMTLSQDSLWAFQKLSNRLAEVGARFLLITATPVARCQSYLASICVSSVSHNPRSTLEKNGCGLEDLKCYGATVFSMTGPHFGDRYGLAFQLMESLVDEGIKPFSFGCTVASMCLAVRQDKAEQTVSAITARFETPSIVKKD